MPLSSVAVGLARVGSWIVSDKAWGIVESTLGNATECAVAYGLVGSLKWGAALLSIASFLVGVFIGRQRFDIQWRGGESMQARVAIAPCTPTDYQEVTSLAPSEKAEEDGRLWYMATPDGDVYPHELTVQALRIIVPYDMRDRRQLLNREGANPVGVGTYGRDWVMSPAAFALQLRFVLGQSLDEVLETAVVSAGAPEEPEAEARPAAARPPSGSALASAEIPTEWGLGRGRLPDPSPSRWRCIASSDGGGKGLLPDEDLDAFVLASGFGMAMKGGRTMLVRALPPDGGDELDARVLALRANATERFLGMREAVAELTETHWDFFPISGPRTVKWVCEFVRENDVTFRSRHAKFKAETGLSSSDQDVSVHELCCRIMHLLLTYDQLNGSELSCAELVCRRLQMAEYRHRERVLTTSRGDELLEDSHLYLGTGETRGLVCISPKLLTFVTDELHKESLVLKERRKLKEERMASRGDDAHGGGGGGDGRARLSGMQSTVDRQKSEIEKLKKQLQLAVELWTCEVVAALNFLNGRLGGDGFDKLSAAQLTGIESLYGHLLEFGPPDVSPTAAYTELRGCSPGYDMSPAKAVLFTEGSVAVPSDSRKCEPAYLLSESVRDLWQDWEKHLLRPRKEWLANVPPHFDARLKSSPKLYASFLHDLFNAGMIEFTSERKHTLAPFFVAKRDGSGQQRMVLDTRRVNRMFYDPDVAELPTAGSWQSLRLGADSSLFLGQCDIEAAFYRFLAPPGLSELMVLPSIDRGALANVLPSGTLDGIVGRRCSPCLKVLPMGWNWSLFFCQHAVEGMLRTVGIGDHRLVHERKVIPDLEGETVAAAYVDGVAVIGSKYDEVVSQLETVYGAFNTAGLKCKEMELPSEHQKFTGLIFDRESGRISLGRSRMWKIRQALLCQASQRYATGKELASLVGHFNWAALLRRPLLCIFQSTYRFIKKAGDSRWRIWPEVIRELRVAAALAPFAYYDAKRPVDSTVYSTDASTGDLDPAGSLHGGYGVTKRELGQQLVLETARVRERWRYHVEGALHAREFAFAARDTSEAPFDGMSFATVSSDVVFPMETWRNVTFGRWCREENILRLEGRALALGVRHKMRALRSRGHLHLMLNDNLSLVLGVEKGRSASPLINQTCRELCSYSVIHDMSVAVRWLPSEWNTSDKGSRTVTGQPTPFATDPRNVGTAWASLARAAADEKANRAKLRVMKFGGANCDPRHGLTFLQRHKVREATIRSFDNHVTSFLAWAAAPSLDDITADRLDVLLAAYLDKLFWEGELAETGSRLLASVQYRLPRVPRPRHGGLPLARAALSGFRVHSRSTPMTPVGKPIVWALIGIAALEGDFEWAGAVALAWDAMIRLPSDLVGMTVDTLVGPGRDAEPRWALLLHPIEGSACSKSLAQDEGVLLRSAAWRGGGGSFLKLLRAARPVGSPLWSFSAATFGAEFRRRLSLVPGAPDMIPYQMRHSAASHATAVEGMPLAELQARLRHTSAQSTARYSRHVRYLAELEKVDAGVSEWAQEVEDSIGQILGQQRRPRLPRFLKVEALAFDRLAEGFLSRLFLGMKRPDAR
ncbi:unnamed protein product [Prorocentrum cordatum]|uniref:Tyr recombinase domain-containing protein n=1 Tax=Prorocentrum cordatum TaxID=2364126 RepID=A0ABN9W8K6_9DINO|nr:unnamed protein product [Polarella glacialis]